MEPTQKPMRKSGLRLEELDGELILFNPQTTKVFYLNSSASIIWQLCDGMHTVAEITDLLSDAYPEAAGEIPGEVESILRVFLDYETIDPL